MQTHEKYWCPPEECEGRDQQCQAGGGITKDVVCHAAEFRFNLAGMGVPSTCSEQGRVNTFMVATQRKVHGRAGDWLEPANAIAWRREGVALDQDSGGTGRGTCLGSGQ